MMRTSGIWLAAIAGFSAVPVQARAQDASSLSVPKMQIEAQPVATALTALARQTGLQIIYGAEAVRGLQSRGSPAGLSASETLGRVLEGTGLRFEFINDHTVTILMPGESASRRVGDEGASVAATPDVRLAQTDAASPAADPDLRSADSGEGRLEEVIVTATKRAQNLQKVPASIAVVGAEEIDRRGLVSAEDYLRGIPGVSQVANQTGSAIVIRGIETSPQAQNFSAGTTVATYFGETPTTNSAGLGGGSNVDLKLVDIARIEVLRGPQGTAFGNSSLGGAVRTIPVAPNPGRVEGRLGVGYSVTSGTGGDNDMLQAVGNLPLIPDKVAIRAVAYRFGNSGFYRNRAGSDETFRSALAAYGAESFAVDDDEVGASRFMGGRLSALFQPTDALKLTISYLRQKTEVDGEGRAETGLYDQSIAQVSPQHVRRGRHSGIFDTDIEITNAVAEYDLGWGSLLGTFSHVASGSVSTASTSSTDPTPFSSLEDSDHRENSGEIRLATRLQGAWNVLAGIYAEDLDDRYYNDYYWFGSPETNIFGTDIDLGEYRDRRNLEQKAAFAEVSWKLMPRLTLTGGARAYEYDRTGLVESTGALLGDVSTSRDAKASGTSYRANLSYEVRDDAMVYAGWSQGFRLGKPQPGLPAGLCDLDGDGIVDGTGVRMEDTLNTKSDDLDSLEIGAKVMLLERRLALNAAAYRIDWTGVPFRTRAPCGLAYNANAGGAVSKGVEFQANAFLTEALRVDFGGSLIDAKLTEDVPAQNAFSGDRLPGSPKVNANLGLQYTFRVGGRAASVRADSTYVGRFYGDLLQSGETRAGGYVKVDASARLTIDRLDVDLYVRNLTDEDTYTWRSLRPFGLDFFGYRLQPRTVGVQLMYGF